MRPWVFFGIALLLAAFALLPRSYIATIESLEPTPTLAPTVVSDFLPAVYATSEESIFPPIWDPRLNELNVTYHPAADCSNGCWQLLRAEYLDEGQSGGLHHVFAKSLDVSGQHVGGTPWRVAWMDGMDQSVTKPPPDWGDLALWDCYFPDQGEAGGYRAYMGTTESRSDVVRGMGLPYCIHTSFRLTWQWNPGIPPTPTATPTATPPPEPPIQPFNLAFPLMFGGQNDGPFPTATPPTITATPRPTHTPLPTATATPSGGTYQGEVVQIFPNCGLTQIFGVVHDQNGNPQPGTRLRITWDGNPTPVYTVAGSYIRPETDASGWDFVMANYPMDQWWRVAVVDDFGNPLSQEVTVHTVSSCEPSDLNVAKIRFREN